jgi:hypothetical protein
LSEVGQAYRKARGLKPKTPKTGAARALIGAARGKGVKGVAARGTLKALKATRNPKVALGLAGGAAGLQVANLSGDFVTNRVLGRKEETSKSYDEVGIYAEISKVDEDKRQIFGWASVTSVNGQPVLDLQDDILPLEEIEKAAYSFVEKSRVGGNMHGKGENGPIHVSDMIESFVVTPEKKKALGLPDDFPEGWWTGFKVNDDQTWADAKSGKLAGLSIHGTGKRVPVGAS